MIGKCSGLFTSELMASCQYLKKILGSNLSLGLGKWRDTFSVEDFFPPKKLFWVSLFLVEELKFVDFAAPSAD